MTSTPYPSKRRVFLVDDHPVTRDGFAQLLNMEEDLQVCGQAGSAAEATEKIGRAHPDLVIVDISLVGSSGIELIKNLVCACPTRTILVLSTHDEMRFANRALRAGARGYVMKSEPTRRILAAIRHVLRGKVYLSQRMHEELAGRMAQVSSGMDSEVDLLSDRELEVFQLLGQGRSTTEIAAKLNMSASTVATHRSHIQEKLSLRNLHELVCRAAQWTNGGERGEG